MLSSITVNNSLQTTLCYLTTLFSSNYIVFCVHLPRRWLSENRHLRYMWLPYTNTVVVVQCNKAESPEAAAAAVAREPPSKYSEEQRLAPLRALLQQSAGKKAPAAAGAAGSAGEGVEGLSATQLRDRLLALAPLDKNWVAKVRSSTRC